MSLPASTSTIVKGAMFVVAMALVSTAGPSHVAAQDRGRGVYETRPYYKNFIPFGVGQFQNEETGKGTFFLVSQVATGAVSVATFAYLQFHLSDRGYVQAEDASTARSLQLVQLGSAVAFYGLVGWGIVDALVHHRPRVHVSERRHGPSSLTWLPVVGRDMTGVGLSFGFR
jgi:hypothetical protein